MFFVARSYLLLGTLGPSIWIAGCARTAPLPPPAAIYSVPQANPPAVVLKPIPQQPPTLEVPGSANPWKPPSSAREWQYIVLHHTAADTGSVDSIDAQHKKQKDSAGKPWLGIGYHFVIGNGRGMPDGEIEPTFRWQQQLHGAHTKTPDPVYNQAGIGIVLVGNFNNGPPSPAQMSAVKRLVRTLKSAYGIPAKNVIGHRDAKATDCPGKHFPMTEVSLETGESQFSSLFPESPDYTRTISQRGGESP